MRRRLGSRDASTLTLQGSNFTDRKRKDMEMDRQPGQDAVGPSSEGTVGGEKSDDAQAEKAIRTMALRDARA